MFSRRIFLNAIGTAVAIAQPQPPDEKARVMRARMGMGEGALKEGDKAPDFELAVLKQKARVRLSSFQGKRPVALLFGSFS